MVFKKWGPVRWSRGKIGAPSVYLGYWADEADESRISEKIRFERVVRIDYSTSIVACLS